MERHKTVDRAVPGYVFKLEVCREAMRTGSRWRKPEPSAVFATRQRQTMGFRRLPIGNRFQAPGVAQALKVWILSSSLCAPQNESGMANLIAAVAGYQHRSLRL